MRNLFSIFLLLICLFPSLSLCELEQVKTVDFIPAGNPREPWGIDIDEGSSLVYVVGCQEPYRLAIIDETTYEILDTVQLSGTLPRNIVLWPSENKAYVTNSGSDNISIVDLYARMETGTIASGSGPIDLCLNSATSLLYVVNQYNASVTVIDAVWDEVIDTIAVGNYPYGICANQTTNKIYVTNQSDYTVSVIDGDSHTVVGTIGTGYYPSGIAVNQVTNRIYVANRDDGTLSVIDGQTDQIIDMAVVGDSPQKVCVDTQRNMIYVVNEGSNDVTVVRGTDHSIVATVPVGQEPIGGIACDEARNAIFVTNKASEDVSIIDGELQEVVAVVCFAWFPHETIFGTDSSTWFMSNDTGNKLITLTGPSSTPVWESAIGYSPGPLCIHNPLERLFALVPAADRMQILNSRTGAIIDTIPVAHSPMGICVNEVTNKVYVVSHESFLLSAFDAVTGALLSTVPLASEPIDVAVNTKTNMIYVTTFGGYMYAIDGETDEITDSLLMPYPPRHCAVCETTNRIYAGGRNATAVFVINGESFSLVKQIDLPGFPNEICVNEELAGAYVCTDENIIMINIRNGIQQIFNVGMITAGCDFDDSSGVLAVSCPSDGVAVILRDNESQDIVSPTVLVGATELKWLSQIDAIHDDVIRGDLMILRQSGGDFSVATEECLANDTPSWIDYSIVPEPGEGFWFLVRSATSYASGSYDTPEPSQIGSRDTEITVSGADCP